MGSRRNLLAFSAAALGAAALPRLARGQNADFDAGRSADVITPKTQEAIDRGLTWLAQAADAFGTRTRERLATAAIRGASPSAASPGLAFMCSGSPPGQGPFGKHIDRCVKFITSVRPGKRLHLASPASARTTCTATASPRCSSPRSTACRTGPTSTAPSATSCASAVKLTCQCQNDAGGWRYSAAEERRRPVDHHLPDHGPAGRPRRRHPRARRSPQQVHRLRQEEPERRRRLPLPDQLGGGSTFPRTAAGVVSLYSAGIYDGEPIEKGLKWLMNYVPGKGSSNTRLFLLRPLLRRAGDVARRRRLLAASGTRRSATRCSPARAATARLARRAKSAPNSAPPWPASSCRCRITTCRSSVRKRIE